MSIEVKCDNCGEEYNVRDDAAGKSLKCKVCGTSIRVPDVDDEPDDEAYDRPRKRRRSSDAGAKTLGPAIGLYVTGGLALVYGIFNMIIALSGNPALQQPPPGADEATRIGYQVGFFGAAIGLPVLNVLVLIGAYCVHSCRAYPLAMAGCILASIPCCSPCLVLGMPFGIWGLVVLAQEDVKQSFS